MGYGEKIMKNWGLYGGGMTVCFVSVMLLVNAILTIVVIKGSISFDTKNNIFGFSIAVLLIAIAGIIVGALTIRKILKADAIYLDVGQNAALKLTATSKTTAATNDTKEPSDDEQSGDESTEDLFS